MKILWFSSKDIDNPQAGNAEEYSHMLMQYLAHHGHHVILLTSKFTGGKAVEMKDNFRVVRLGNRFTVYYAAFRYYKQQLKDWPDLVIEEADFVPFFTKLYVAEKSLLYLRQVRNSLWFYLYPFPVSLFCYLFEVISLRIISSMPVVTFSESGKRVLLRYGFRDESVYPIVRGSSLPAFHDLSAADKFLHPTIVSIGRISAEKRTDHIVRAFLIAKQQFPELRLILAGNMDKRFGRHIKAMITESRHQPSVTILGPIDDEEKVELLRQSHIFCLASIKENSAVVVAEANSQGTPVVAYDTEGVRDRIRHGKTGLLVKDDAPAELAEAIVLLLNDHEEYERLRSEAWKHSRGFSSEVSFRQFSETLDHVSGKRASAQPVLPIPFSSLDKKNSAGDISNILTHTSHSPVSHLAISTDAEAIEMAEHLPQGNWGDQLESLHLKKCDEAAIQKLSLLHTCLRSFRSPTLFQKQPSHLSTPSNVSRLSSPISIPKP